MGASRVSCGGATGGTGGPNGEAGGKPGIGGAPGYPEGAAGGGDPDAGAAGGGANGFAWGTGPVTPLPKAKSPSPPPKGAAGLDGVAGAGVELEAGGCTGGGAAGGAAGTAGDESRSSARSQSEAASDVVPLWIPENGSTGALGGHRAARSAGLAGAELLTPGRPAGSLTSFGGSAFNHAARMSSSTELEISASGFLPGSFGWLPGWPPLPHCSQNLS